MHSFSKQTESFSISKNFSDDPICLGLEGVLEAYRKAQMLVAPAATVEYSPVIRKIIKLASNFKKFELSMLMLKGDKGEC